MSGAVRFPDGFLWGTATSAHQVEGGNRWNDWWRFEQIPGAIRGGDTSGDACRMWERFDEDFARSAADGHRAHRLSIEWSRIEPAPGAIESAAVHHYHKVFASMRRHGLEPMVTLHHFTNPVWIADHGGWESRDTIEAFLRFVRFCATEYGGEVDRWCTVNEPEVFAFRSYSEGVWPPRKRDDSAALCVIGNLLEAHGRAYRVIHEHDRIDADGDGRAALVGFSKYLVQLEPSRAWMPLDAIRAAFEDRVFNAAVLEACVAGAIDLSIPGARAVKRTVPELAGALDWMGINYYTRWKVKATGPEPHVVDRGAPVNDLGWEVWPEGLARAAHRATAVARRVGGGVPVYITEHGFADAADAFRPRALAQSLAALGRAIAAGADVRGYYHWSLLDNFEWAEGYAGRFGLYAVDFADPERQRRRTASADLYARIVRANAVEAAPGA